VAGLRRVGLDPIVAINHFITDTEAEHRFLIEACRERLNTQAVTCRHWAQGSAGITELAQAVVAAIDRGASAFEPLYPDSDDLASKIRTVARDIYGAADISLSPQAIKDRQRIEQDGFGHLPVCMAKTQYSFSTDPTRMGAPTGHIVEVRGLRLAAGAGFVVVLCGDIRTMPGLPRTPAAETIGLQNGVIEGLF
jgi:formate--tetrahydrofolate ligase